MSWLQQKIDHHSPGEHLLPQQHRTSSAYKWHHSSNCEHPMRILRTQECHSSNCDRHNTQIPATIPLEVPNLVWGSRPLVTVSTAISFTLCRGGTSFSPRAAFPVYAHDPSITSHYQGVQHGFATKPFNGASQLPTTSDIFPSNHYKRRVCGSNRHLLMTTTNRSPWIDWSTSSLQRFEATTSIDTC